MPALDRTLCFELNRLAGTLDANGDPTLAAQGAANVWAGTTGLALQGALNALSGPAGIGVREECNDLGGTTDEDEEVALQSA